MNLFGLWWAWLTIGSGLGIFLTYLKLSKENDKLKELVIVERENREDEAKKFRDAYVLHLPRPKIGVFNVERTSLGSHLSSNG